MHDLRTIGRPDMTIAVDWDVEHQNKQIKRQNNVILTSMRVAKSHLRRYNVVLRMCTCWLCIMPSEFMPSISVKRRLLCTKWTQMRRNKTWFHIRVYIKLVCHSKRDIFQLKFLRDID